MNEFWWWMLMSYLCGLATIPVAYWFYTLFFPYLGR